MKRVLFIFFIFFQCTNILAIESKIIFRIGNEIITNIDIKNSWMVGDQTSDIELGRRVGLLTIAVETGFGLKDLKNRVRPDFKVPNLLEAVSIITGAG